jgi:hypothetical protein
MDPNIKVVTITDLSDDDLEKVARDYRDSGAEVTTARQPDGKWKLEARFTLRTKYPASGQSVLP